MKAPTGASAHTGTVYLLHFDRPLAHARHYVGWSADLPKRIEQHRRGLSGARLMAAVKDAGIGFRVARVWDGDRAFERRIKNRHATPRLCPVCQASAGGAS